jgi:hypothetical protein
MARKSSDITANLAALNAELAEVHRLIKRKAIDGTSTAALRDRRVQLERLITELREANAAEKDEERRTVTEQIAVLAQTFAETAERIVSDRMMLLKIPRRKK